MSATREDNAQQYRSGMKTLGGGRNCRDYLAHYLDGYQMVAVAWAAFTLCSLKSVASFNGAPLRRLSGFDLCLLWGGSALWGRSKVNHLQSFKRE